MTSNQNDGQDLGTTVYQASNEAFMLAQQAATGEGDATERAKRAKELNAQFTTLWPQIEAAQLPDMGVTQAWSDGRLDLGWILSKGETSPSTRLFYYMQALPQAAGADNPAGGTTPTQSATQSATQSSGETF